MTIRTLYFGFLGEFDNILTKDIIKMQNAFPNSIQDRLFKETGQKSEVHSGVFFSNHCLGKNRFKKSCLSLQFLSNNSLLKYIHFMFSEICVLFYCIVAFYCVMDFSTNNSVIKNKRLDKHSLGPQVHLCCLVTA